MNEIQGPFSSPLGRNNFQPFRKARSLATPIPFTGSAQQQPIVLSPQQLIAFSGVRFGASGDESSTSSALSGASVLDGVQRRSLAHVNEAKEALTLTEYVDLVLDNPERYLPTSSGYTLDALKSYAGQSRWFLGERIPQYSFTQAPWRKGVLKDDLGIVGQDMVIHEVVQKLESFRKEGKSNRIILLVGPKGCGKSETWNIMFDAIEQYARKPEGVRYTPSWVFPNPGAGLRRIRPATSEAGLERWKDGLKERYASDSIPAERIGAQLPSNLNINPFFLLPEETRIEIIKHLRDTGKIKPGDNYDYYIKGQLDNYSRKILDGLIRQYGGNAKLAYRHARIEPWRMSRQDGRGLGVIPPAETRDAFLQPETPDVNWKLLPSWLRTIGLERERGYLPMANGGLLNLDDMGREDSQRYLYLLITGETGEATISEGRLPVAIREQLDVTFVASANPDSVYRMFQQGQWGALSDRFDIVVVPHIRMYKDEALIHNNALEKEEERGRVLTPDVGELFSLWLTMTRLLGVDQEHDAYLQLDDPAFIDGLGKLDPLRKALLYQNEDVNSFEFGDNQRFSQQEAERLKRHVKLIAKERNYDAGKTEFSFYEGGFGVSARDGQEMLGDLLTELPAGNAVSVLDVLEFLAEYVKGDVPYFEELKANVKQVGGNVRCLEQGGTPRQLLKLAEGHQRRKVQHHIKEALGIYRQDAQVQKMAQYLAHLDAKVAGTIVQDSQYRHPNGRAEQPSDELIQEMEDIVLTSDERKSDEKRETARARLLAKQKQWRSGDELGENMDRLYRSQLQRLMAYEEKEWRKRIKGLISDIFALHKNPQVFDNDAARKDDLPELKESIEKLGQLGYPTGLLPQVMEWAFADDKYIADGTYKRRSSVNDDH